MSGESIPAEQPVAPGKIALFGSGEIAPSGRRAHEWLFQQMEQPIRVAVLETPAGFQPNSAWVAGRLAEFIEDSLQNYHPQVTVVPARRRDGKFSTQDRELTAPLLDADYIFTGPGSPSYAARHLADTWAWHAIVARQRLGAHLALASAAAIAAGSHVLPVYEIFKAGADLHWLPGLDLFRPYGLALAIVTHWNNQQGGEHLDTSRAFMGVERMERLEAMLPPSATLLGIDEHTAVILDFAQGHARVMGQGSVTICHGKKEHHFSVDEVFDLTLLGKVKHPSLEEKLSAEVIEAAKDVNRAGDRIPSNVATLIEKREAARQAENWAEADALRERLANRGFIIQDTPQGPQVTREH